MRSFKKIFFILILVSFCFLVLSNLALAQKTEEIYPEVSGAERPTTVKTLLPDYIKYLFNFAIIIAGLVAFASLIYGGFRYIASAGNPTALSDARDQITAGILGLMLLLGAYILLIQINPELTILKIGKAEFNKGIILYKGNQAFCNGRGSNTSGLKEGEEYLRVRSNYSSLGDDFNNEANSVYFYNDSEEMEVQIFPQENYKGIAWKSDDHAADSCKALGANSQSVRLIWKMPGVYLFSDTACKEDPHLFTSSISDFGGFINFNDAAKSIKIIPRRVRSGDGLVWNASLAGCAMLPGPGPPPTCNDMPWCCEGEMVVVDKLGAVLHEHSNFKGDAEVFFGGPMNDPWPPNCIPLEAGGAGPQCDQNMDTSYCYEHVNKGGGDPKASSITIFLQRPPDAHLPTGGVTLYQNYNFNDDVAGDECIYPTFGVPVPLPIPQWVDFNGCNILVGAGGFPGTPNGTSSIRIEGNYIAVLFRGTTGGGGGRGEVFTASDIRLKDNHIGDDEAEYLLVIPVIKKGI